MNICYKEAEQGLSTQHLCCFLGQVPNERIVYVAIFDDHGGKWAAILQCSSRRQTHLLQWSLE